MLCQLSYTRPPLSKNIGTIFPHLLPYLIDDPQNFLIWYVTALQHVGQFGELGVCVVGGVG